MRVILSTYAAIGIEDGAQLAHPHIFHSARG